MHTAESWLSHHTANTHGTSSPGRCLLAEPEVRSVFVVVTHVIRKQPFQVGLIEGDDVIQQVLPTASDPALGNSVLPGASERNPNWIHGHRPDRYRNLKAILGISVKDEKPGSRSIREGLSQLLDDPRAGGVPRDIKVQDTTVIVRHDEKAVEHTERDGGDREEVHRRDGFSMIAQKGEPALGGLGIPGRSTHPAGDGSLTDVEIQHQEFAVDAWCTPGRVLSHHPEDQVSDLFRDTSSSGRLASP
jgi:hypothetical protein